MRVELNDQAGKVLGHNQSRWYSCRLGAIAADPFLVRQHKTKGEVKKMGLTRFEKIIENFIGFIFHIFIDFGDKDRFRNGCFLARCILELLLSYEAH